MPASDPPADGASSSDPAEEADFQNLAFAEALERLEALVERLDSDDPPALEEALDAYEEGSALARECLRRLDEAELRVERLSMDD